MTTFEEIIGYRFQNKGLLEQAFTHKSYHNEKQSESFGHNERLEFLGDAVLDLTLSDYLMGEYPLSPEGELSKIRASLVNETLLAEVAKSFSMSEWLLLGKGELVTNGAEKPRLLASMFEAFIGALYLDAGYEYTRTFVTKVFKKYVEETDPKVGFLTDFKTRLQEVTQEKFKKIPIYQVISQSGPDHEKIFSVGVKIQDDLVFLGEGRSKKQAEQSAAEKALKEYFK